MPNRTWTHAELVDRGARWLRNSAKVFSELTCGYHPISARCAVVLTEAIGAGGSEIPDVIGWSNGGRISIVIECKTSRADFRADFRKWARHTPRQCVGRFRFYMALPGIIAKEAVAEVGWGLLEVHGRSVRIIQYSREHPYRLRGEHALLWSALRKEQLDGPDRRISQCEP